MDDVIARIKNYILEFIYPTICADLGISGDYLDFIVRDVVDKALIFTNREQLVKQYERDLTCPDIDTTDPYYPYIPLPQPLERVVAKTVVETARTIVVADQGFAIDTLSDNGQTIKYGDQLLNFFNSSDDATVFAGSLTVLRRYMIANTVHYSDSYDHS